MRDDDVATRVLEHSIAVFLKHACGAKWRRRMRPEAKVGVVKETLQFARTVGLVHQFRTKVIYPRRITFAFGRKLRLKHGGAIVWVVTKPNGWRHETKFLVVFP